MGDRDIGWWSMSNPAHVPAATRLVVRNANGREFLVRVVRMGDCYGLDDCLTHDKPEPLIEFYDLKYAGTKFGARGQFVSRYDASTIAKHVPGVGLDLHMGVDGWKVDGPAMVAVIDLAREVSR